MTRSLIIKINCDFCSAEVSEEDAHSGEIVLKGKFYEIDLCDSCAPALTDKLTPMPASQASTKTQAAPKDPSKKSAATPKADRTVPCPICGALCKNDLGVRFHMTKMHPDALSLEDNSNQDESS